MGHILSVTIAWSDVAVATTAILGVGAIVGGFYRWMLLPNLRDQLIRPMQETNREVTGGDDEKGVRELVDDLSGEIENATASLEAMALMFDGHLDWSQEEVDRLWAELNRQRAAGERRPGRHRGDRGDNAI